MSHIYDRLDPDDWDGNSCAITKEAPPGESGDWLRFNSSATYGNGVLIGHEWDNFELTCTAIQVNGGGAADYIIIRFRGNEYIMGETDSTPPTGRVAYRGADSPVTMSDGVNVTYLYTGTGFDPTTKHDIRLYVNGSRLILEVNGTALIDVNNFPSGTGGAIAIEDLYNNNDVYITDLMIRPASLSTNRDMVTVDVGNRRFLCEDVYTYKWSDFNLAGNTNPTNLGTENNPIVDFKETTNAANQTSQLTVAAGTTSNLFKTGDDIIISCEWAFMEGESSTDALAARCLLITLSGYSRYIECRLNHPGNLAYFYVQSPNAYTATQALTYDKTGNYFEVKAAKYGTLAIMQIHNNHIEYDNPTIKEFGQAPISDNIPFLYTQHDAGEVSHARMRNFKAYRILGELS